MSTKSKLVILLLTAVLLSSGSPLSRVLAANATAQLIPAYQNIGVGQTTTIAFRVLNVEELFGYQVTIAFDPAVLEVIDAKPDEPGVQVDLGSFLRPDLVHQNSADNGAGEIVCVISQIAPTSAVSGSGDLFTITFRGKAQGISDIRFTDLKLANVNGLEISAARQEGQIGVGNVTQPTATPTPTFSPSTPTPTPTPIVGIPTATPVAGIPTATPSPGGDVVYVVRTGDTLYSIARRYGVDMADLVRVNAIANPSYIRVGQRLIIRQDTSGTTAPPAPAPAPVVYVVRRGDTLYSIAGRYRTTVRAIALANRIANPSRIFVGQRLTIAADGVPLPTSPPSGRIHMVQRGQTLYSIARHYGTTMWAIAIANNLRNPNIIYLGQRLAIP